MTSKIIREDGTTQLTNIKSCVYTETVNAGDGLRPGCVASAYITVEVYGSQSSAPSAGEALTYYQVDPEGNDTLIGVFYAEPSVPSKSTYQFIAYDAVSKLDMGYSARLNEMQLDFPMSVYDLVSDACTYAGVTLGSASWQFSTLQVNAFYADGLTCRSILQYAAELAGNFVRCDTSGNVVFGWYTTNSTYSIHPGSTQSSYRAYKQNGLTYDNYVTSLVDAVAVRPIGTDGAAYIYPQSAISIVVTDPNGDGNIVIQNIIVSDDGNGNLYLGANASDPSSNGNITVSDSATVVNPYTVEDNLLLNGATPATFLAVAQYLYGVMSSLPTYRHSEIELFVNENPFRAGEFVTVTDIQNVTFLTPIFEMTVAPSGATLRSSGKRTYNETNSASVSKKLANLSATVVEIDKLKVGWASIDTAVIDSLEANGINADWITSGTLVSTGEYEDPTTGVDNAQRVEIGNGHITMAGADLWSQELYLETYPSPGQTVTYTGDGLVIDLPADNTGNYVTQFLLRSPTVPVAYRRILGYMVFGNSSTATPQLTVYQPTTFNTDIKVGNSAQNKSRSISSDNVDLWNTASEFYDISSEVTIPSTLPTGVSSVSLAAYQIGHTVNMTLRFQLSAALGSTGAQIATDLPIPVEQWSSTASAQTAVAGALVRVTTTGNLMVYYGASGIYNIAFSYPIASS